MVSKLQNDHYISRFMLRRFAINPTVSKKQQMIFTLKKNSQDIYQQYIQDTACHKGYDSPAHAKFLQKTENDFSRICKKFIEKRERLCEESLTLVRNFLIISLLRSPYAKDLLKVCLRKNINKMADLLNISPNILIKAIDSEEDQYWKDLEKRTLILFNEGKVSGLISNAFLLQFIYSPQDLIIGDSPVVPLISEEVLNSQPSRESFGLENNHFFMPVSKNAFILMHNKNIAGEQTPRLQLNSSLCNRLQCYFASNEVYGSSFEVLKNINQLNN